jgi:hypothetical protein
MSATTLPPSSPRDCHRSRRRRRRRHRVVFLFINVSISVFSVTTSKIESIRIVYRKINNVL